MLNLLQNYSIGEIFIFIIILALAAKELFTLVDYFKKKLYDGYDGRQKIEDEREEFKKELVEFKKSLEELRENQTKNQEILNVLIQSDVEDIRSWIVREHHYYRDNPEAMIDDFQMDCIEKRFACYEKEGGNSYIHDLVYELREIHNHRNKK